MPDQDDQNLNADLFPIGPGPANSEAFSSKHFVDQGLPNGDEAAHTRGERIVARLRGQGDISLSTDEIMAFMRGE